MASKRNQRRRECGRKVRYADASAASRAAYAGNRSEAASGPQGRPIHTYRCQQCGSWHIGHMPKWLQDKIERKRR